MAHTLRKHRVHPQLLGVCVSVCEEDVMGGGGGGWGFLLEAHMGTQMCTMSHTNDISLQQALCIEYSWGVCDLSRGGTLL